MILIYTTCCIYIKKNGIGLNFNIPEEVQRKYFGSLNELECNNQQYRRPEEDDKCNNATNLEFFDCSTHPTNCRRDLENGYIIEGELWHKCDNSITCELNPWTKPINFHPSGTSISLHFNLVYENLVNDFSHDCTNNLAIKSEEIYSVQPLLNSTFSEAWSTYKKLVWDNPNHQYGKFTYGIPHDQTTLIKKEDGSVFISPYSTPKKIYRPWSYSHYQNISIGWMNFLHYPKISEFNALVSISEAFKNSGTYNIGSIKGYMKHGKSTTIPWSRDNKEIDYVGYGHSIDPSAHFYNYLLADDYISKELYINHHANYYGVFQGLGSWKDNTTTSLALLDYYSNFRDPKSLVMIGMGMNESSVNTSLDDFDIIYGDKPSNIYNCFPWLEMHLEQFRDTARVKLFLNELYDLPNEKAKTKFQTLGYRILYDKLFDMQKVLPSNLTKKNYYNCLSNALTKISTLDNLNDEYAFIVDNLSTSSFILRDIPYLLEFASKNKNNLTSNIYSTYPGVNYSGSYGNQSNSLFYLPKSNSARINFRLNNYFVENERHSLRSFIKFNKDYVFDFICSERNQIDFSTPSTLGLTTDSMYEQIELNEPLEGITSLSSFHNNDIFHLNYSTGNFLTTLYEAPYFQELSLYNWHNRGVELYQMFGEKDECFYNIENDCKSSRYKVRGYNTYYLNSSNDADSLHLKITSNSSNVYYKLLYYPFNTNSSNTSEIVQHIKALAQNSTGIGDHILSRQIQQDDEVVIIEGLLTPGDTRYFNTIPLNGIPVALVINGRNKNGECEISYQIKKGSNLIQYPKNSLFASTEIEDVVELFGFCCTTDN